ncbi:MAG: SCP2 sterol-binding domain-containing protein [Asgard group archaeon]|nr:SCP2 sterol-binding domain-containing protein [Asgard group archaeon]
MVSDEEIRDEINNLCNKLTSEKFARHFKGWNKTMQYFFSDTQDYWYLKLIDGQPEEPVKGKIENPEISYEMTTDDFMSLMQGEVSGLKLYNAKRLKIKASMPDIIKLQKLN